MSFSMNYSTVQDSEIIPAGEYECIIRNAEIKQTPNGAYKTAFSLVIRNDIQQRCADRYLFLDVWRKKEPNENDMQVNGFNFAQLMSIAKAAAIPDGTSFGSLEQFLGMLAGRCLRVTVTHREYNGKKYESIDQLRGIAPTKFPECRHTMKQTAGTAANSAPVSAPVSAPAPVPNRQQFTPPPAPLPVDLSDFEEITAGDNRLPF